jgi:hypothetical protein
MRIRSRIGERPADDAPQPHPPSLSRRRLTADEIASGRVEVRVARGRVELGTSPDGAARMRWSMRRGTPRVRARKGRLTIRARRVRLILDLPPQLRVQVRLRFGEITSWGAGGELDLVAEPGRVTCRELRSPVAHVRGERVNLHFAAPPQQVEVAAERATVTLPPGPYTITAPPSAEVSAGRAATPDVSRGTVTVHADDVRILAAAAPLLLIDPEIQPGPGRSGG